MSKPILVHFLAGILVTASVSLANAQETYEFAGMGRRPLVTSDYKEIDGNPFYSKEFTKGHVAMTNGKTYTNVLLMLDEVTGQLTFKYGNAEPMIFAEEVKEFSFLPPPFTNINATRFINGPAIDPRPGANNFYQVLVGGKTMLLKRTIKTFIESSAYGAATKVKSVQTNYLYYITHQGKSEKFTNIKQLVEALNTQNTELVNLSKKLPAREEASFVQIVEKYNSL